MYSRQIKELETQSSNLKNEMEVCQTESAKLQQELQQHIQQLHSELEIARKKIFELEQQERDMSQELENKERECERKKEEISCLIRDKKERKEGFESREYMQSEELREWRDKEKTWTKKEKDLSRETEDLKAILLDLEGELKVKEKLILKLDDKLKRKKLKMLEVDTKLKEKERKISELEETTKNTENAFAQKVDEEQREASWKINQLKAEIRDRDQQINELTQKLEKSQEAYEKSSVKFHSLIEDNQQKISDLENALLGVRKREEKVTFDLDEQIKELERVQTNASQWCEMCNVESQRHTGEKEEWKEKENTFLEQTQRHDSKLRELQKELDNTEQKLDQFRQDSLKQQEYMETQISNLKDTTTQAQKEIDKLTEINKKMKLELEGEKLNFEKSLEEKQQLQLTINSLDHKLAKFQGAPAEEQVVHLSIIESKESQLQPQQHAEIPPKTEALFDTEKDNKVELCCECARQAKLIHAQETEIANLHLQLKQGIELLEQNVLQIDSKLETDKQNEELREKVKLQESELQKFHEMQESFMSLHSTASNSFDDLVVQIAECAVERDHLAWEVENLRNQLKISQDEIDSLAKSVLELTYKQDLKLISPTEILADSTEEQASTTKALQSLDATTGSLLYTQPLFAGLEQKLSEEQALNQKLSSDMAEMQKVQEHLYSVTSELQTWQSECWENMAQLKFELEAKCTENSQLWKMIESTQVQRGMTFTNLNTDPPKIAPLQSNALLTEEELTHQEKL